MLTTIILSLLVGTCIYSVTRKTPEQLMAKALKPRTSSTNFVGSILAIIFSAIGAQGIEIPDNATERVLEAFQSMDALTIIVAITPVLIVPVLKLVEKVQKDGFDWSFVRGTNFLFYVSSFLVLLLELWGVIPPDTGKAAVITMQSSNMAIHFNQDYQRSKLIA